MVNDKAIVYIIDKITEINGVPCKKTLQKIVYLIEEKKIDLGCNYGIHFYGPYSADLDYAVRNLFDEGVLKIDYTPMSHSISVLDCSAVGNYSNDTIDNIINSFGKDSPSDLELVATALYVYNSLKDREKIKAGVKKLKGTKYSDSQIEEAITKLEDNNYITA